MKWTAGKIVRRLLRTIAWTVFGLVSLLSLALLMLQFHWTQKIITDKIVRYISGKTHSVVRLGGINIRFPKSVLLTDLYLEDLHGDTLLYAHRLVVNLAMNKLFSSRLDLISISLEGATAHIRRKLHDSSYNFDFIPRAFTAAPSSGGASSGKPWTFTIGEIRIAKTRIILDDRQANQQVDFFIGKFGAHFSRFDPGGAAFALSEVSLEGSRASVKMGPHDIPADTSAWHFPFDLELKRLTLHHNSFHFETDNLLAEAAIGELILEADKTDLKTRNLQWKSCVINGCTGRYTIKKSVATVASGPISSGASSPGWTVTLTDMKGTQNEMHFDNWNDPRATQGMDYSHLVVFCERLRLHQLVYSPSMVSIHVSDLAMSEARGFRLLHLETGVQWDSAGIQLTDLKLKTPESDLDFSATVSFPSLRALHYSPGSCGIALDLHSSVVALREVAFFYPALTGVTPLSLHDDPRFTLRAGCRGTLGHLLVHNFQLATGHQTEIRLDGAITGLPDAANAFYDLSFQKVTSGKEDLQNLFIPGTLPENIDFPALMELAGFFRGRMHQFDATVHLQSSFGVATATVTMPAFQTYCVDLSTDAFDLGKLLYNPQELGPVTLVATINGSGYTPDSLAGSLFVTVPEAVFHQYNYHHLSLSGDYTARQFNGRISVRDTNLQADYRGLARFDTLDPQFHFVLNLQGADLQALHFSSGDWRIRGQVVTNLTGAGAEHWNGYLALRHLGFTRNDTMYTIDSVLLASLTNASADSIRLQSPFFQGSLFGKIRLQSLGSDLADHFNRYIHGDKSTPAPSGTSQDFRFRLELEASELYTALFPGLKKFVPGSIRGRFSEKAHRMDLEIKIPALAYSNMEIDSLHLWMRSDADSLRYRASFSNLSFADYRMIHTLLTGSWYRDTASLHLSTLDSSRQTDYQVSADLVRLRDGFQLHVYPDLILLKELWAMDPANELLLHGGLVEASHWAISRNGATIGLEGSNDRTASLRLLFHSLPLEVVTGFIKAPQRLAAGMLNGSVAFSKQGASAAFRADFGITGFVFRADTLGDISLEADHTTPGRYTLNFSVEGAGNHWKGNGYYATSAPGGEIYLEAVLHPLNLASMEKYTGGQLTHLRGLLNGKLVCSGNLRHPILNGNLHFDQTVFHLQFSNSEYKINQQELVFVNSRLALNGFKLLDSINHEAIVNGWLQPDSIHQVSFNLNVKTTDFMVINSPENIESTYYGRVIADSYTTLQGNLDFPKVNAYIKLKDGSALTVANRPGPVEAQVSTGIVIFDIKNTPADRLMYRQKVQKIAPEQFSGLEVVASLEINNRSTLTIITDPASGDSLMVKGNAALNYNRDPSGKTSLTGRYEITEGVYQMNFYNFIKRKFLLKQGGNIVWSGDLEKADMNLDAVYNAKTAPLNLLQNEVAGLSDQERNMYRQQLPFLLNMHMQGELLNPVITFSLDIPDKDRGELNGTIYAKLNQLNQDESELNKQVFALLLFNRFVTDDPLQSGQNSDVENIARNSVSQLLSQQLNRFTGNVIKGMDITLNVNSFEDYSSGSALGRTQLQLDVTKQLFSNRLSVELGGNVELEGHQARQNSVGGIAGDISATYKLTPDGIYRIVYYRRNQYDVLEGDLVETGIGLLFIKDFESSRDLFIRTKQEKEARSQKDKPGVPVTPVILN